VDGSNHWEDPEGWAWRDLLDAPERSGTGTRPEDFRIASVYPNPFNATTRIDFDLHQQTHATLKVFDLLGREVATLADRRMAAGRHTVSFHGGELASGIYFVKLESDGISSVRKIALVR
jgi:hypothetical protein